jgi:hypothetical protein
VNVAGGSSDRHIDLSSSPPYIPYLSCVPAPVIDPSVTVDVAADSGLYPLVLSLLTKVLTIDVMLRLVPVRVTFTTQPFVQMLFVHPSFAESAIVIVTMPPSITMLVIHLFFEDSAPAMVTKAQSIISDEFAFAFDFVLLKFCFFA